MDAELKAYLLGKKKMVLSVFLFLFFVGLNFLKVVSDCFNHVNVLLQHVTEFLEVESCIDLLND